MRRGSVGQSSVFLSALADSSTDSSGHAPARDSSEAPQRQLWTETEARIGWTVGRLALDGVVGWRPSVSTIQHAMWLKGYATLQMGRAFALSVGAGTVTRRASYTRSGGRFGSIAIRLAPAALLRPKAPPAITAAASALS